VGNARRAGTLSANPIEEPAMATPAPTITGVEPSWGPVAGGTEVVINGTNFDTDALVTFDGSPALVIAASATSFTVTTPAHAAGTAPIVIKNGDGQSATGSFLYSDTAPVTDMAMPTAPDMATGHDMAKGGGGGGGGCSMVGEGAPTGAAALLFGALLLALALRRRFLA